VVSVVAAPFSSLLVPGAGLSSTTTPALGTALVAAVAVTAVAAAAHVEDGGAPSAAQLDSGNVHAHANWTCASILERKLSSVV
jgi:hypothetical protein